MSIYSVILVLTMCIYDDVTTMTHSLPADADILAGSRAVGAGGGGGNCKREETTPHSVSVPHCHRSLPKLLKETVQGKWVVVARAAAAILVRPLRLGTQLGPQLLPPPLSV